MVIYFFHEDTPAETEVKIIQPEPECLKPQKIELFLKTTVGAARPPRLCAGVYLNFSNYLNPVSRRGRRSYKNPFRQGGRYANSKD